MRTRVGVLLSSALAIALSPLPVVALQESPPASPATPLVIRVGVDLIQIDAKVTDKLGRPVTDLRAQDFILEVDGERQPLTNVAYFDGAEAAAAAAGKETSLAPAAGSDTDHKVVFLIDDLNLSFDSMYHTRRALTKFASEWDAQRTQAALLKTSDKPKAISFFLTPDQFEKAAASLRYTTRSNQGIQSRPPIVESMATGRSAARLGGGQGAKRGAAPDVETATEVNQSKVSANLKQRMFSLVSTMNILRSVPGRKAVVLVSEGFPTAPQGADPLGFKTPLISLFFGNSENRAAVALTTEVANRASVVLYTVDPQGLVVDFPNASEEDFAVSARLMRARALARFDSQGSLQDMADATGGLAIANRNDLPGGFGDVLRDQRAYYLIGFEPKANTFTKDAARPKFHKIRLSVNRTDVRVRTRDGFYGVTDEELNDRAPMGPGKSSRQ